MVFKFRRLFRYMENVRRNEVYLLGSETKRCLTSATYLMASEVSSAAVGGAS
eukprot:CAMPEP_0194278322 /NCGR_PEP_ID=MMETSP0169-20130528/10399_1 /TAXON_ID=218684 /ORGANISM="Corethron pennatum, Strain L29A3" /LENGTH=51 /DNA_ID=CAMNT_0039022475 /DNA_START=750 /DNA_END=902 /DNA_ORIENTATION=-